MSKFRRKIAFILLLSIFATSFSPLTAKKAHAQWVVFDPANFANTLATQLKEYGLDGIAGLIAKTAIKRIVGSTVNWINSGFRGAPSFVTDPQKYFVNVADQTAADYIFRGPTLSQLCGPLQQRIRLSLARNYVRDNTQIYGCTLNGVVGSIEGFMNDFQQGGWEGFFELSQVQQNNPIGAYLLAEGDLFTTVSSVKEQRTNELNWGNGFLSLKECAQYDLSTASASANANVAEDEELQQINAIEAEDKPPCLRYRTTTPGDVISRQLNDTLQLGNQSLVTADEINEIIGALLSQLVDKALGGLRSLSRSGSGSAGGSISQQLSNSSTSTPDRDIFGQQVNTQILDVYSSTDPNDPNYRYSASELAGIDQNNLVYPPTNPPPTDQTPADQNCQFWRPEQWTTWASEQGVEIQYVVCPLPEPGTQRTAESGSRGTP